MYDIQQGMYGLPQSGMISKMLLIEIIVKHGYRPCEITPGLWNYDTHPVIFG